MPELNRTHASLFRRERAFARNWLLQAALILYLAIWGLLAVRPYDQFDWWLENLLVVAAAAGFVSTYRLFAFSNLSYMMIIGFVLLHTIGAHYAYNTTPLDKWMKGIFHYERDHYDRIVHCAFGLLIAYPVHEFMLRVVRIRKGWSYVLVPCIILAMGAFYELIEMWVALVLAPEKGALFLGSQGDQWDAHHDMELALYGAAFAMAFTAVIGRLRGERSVSHDNGL
jgi:putative membrane protein